MVLVDCRQPVEFQQEPEFLGVVLLVLRWLLPQPLCGRS